MNLLKAIKLDRLRNGEYIQMGDDVNTITTELAGVAPEIAHYARAFNDKMAAVNAAFVNDPASPLTHVIELADARRDDCITGLTFLAQGNSYSADPNKKAAGEALYRVISVYSSGIVSTIARQSYAAESASLSNLLTDFSNKPELAAAITTLDLADWAEELQAANNDFKAKYQQRTDAYGDASPDTVRGLRVDADAA